MMPRLANNVPVEPEMTVYRYKKGRLHSICEQIDEYVVLAVYANGISCRGVISVDNYGHEIPMPLDQFFSTREAAQAVYEKDKKDDPDFFNWNKSLK
jgi:hypothetical protein